MKKITLGIAFIFGSITANAAANNLPSATSVYVPMLCSGFTVGITGLYWRTSSNFQDYGVASPNPPITPFDGHYLQLKPNYDWGYKANIGYIFPYSGSDIQLTYTQYDQNKTNSDFSLNEIIAPYDATLITTPIVFEDIIFYDGSTLVSTNPTLPVVLDAGTIIQPDVAVTASIETNHYALDLNYGQHINIGSNFKLRWFGGLRYANLEQKLQINSSALTRTVTPVILTDVAVVAEDGEGTTVTGTISFITRNDVAFNHEEAINQKAKFQGVGPQFGTDVTYELKNGFGLTGSLSTALLVGQQQSTFNNTINNETVYETLANVNIAGDLSGLDFDVIITGNDDFITANSGDTSYSRPDTTRIVPNMDAKIGVNYVTQFCNSTGTTLSIEAGYAVSYYWNSIDRLPLSGSIDFAADGNRTTNISFGGPYVGIQVKL